MNKFIKCMVAIMMLATTCTSSIDVFAIDEANSTETADPLNPAETIETTEDAEETTVPTVEPTSLPEETYVPEETVSPSTEPTDTNVPDETIVPTETPVSTDEPTEDDQLEDKSFSNDIGEMVEFETGEIDGMKYSISDTGLTVSQAKNMIKNSDAGIATYASAQLIREYRLASFQGTSGLEYVSKFMLNGMAAYCIEPMVMVILDGSGNGPIYDSTEPTDYSSEQLQKLGRIMWYGYGHPLTGSTDEAYMATQLLIWQITAPDDYQQIVSTLKWCDTKDQVCAASSTPVDVSAKMAEIENLVNNWDTVPSFADPNHGVTHYELDWNETLVLEDDGSYNYFSGQAVLDWFNEQPEEAHQGINIKQDGNKLLIDIDDIYYAGYDTDEGITLTFIRKDSEWQKVISSLMLWISGENQKLMTFWGYDPSPLFQLSFKLRTANLEINKQNEYYEENSFVAGTQFVVGWMEDPEHQYRHDGDGDPNWKDVHDFNKDIDPDLYGGFNFVNGNKTYYPIMTEDGSNIRVFTVGSDGKMHLDDLLPRNKSWWVAEWDATDPYNINPIPFKMNTGDQDTTTSQVFVNELRDVEIDIVKTDIDDEFNKLNGSEWEIYEIGNIDKDKENTMFGALEGHPQESMPYITYMQFLKLMPNPEVGKSFYYNGFIYTLKDIDETRYKLTVKRYRSIYTENPITYDQIPENIKVGEKFTVINTDYEAGEEVAGSGNDVETEFEVVQISDNMTIVKVTDASTSITIDNLIGYKSLNEGQHLEVDGQAYTVKSVKYDELGNLVSLEVYPATMFYIQKPLTDINYEVLPLEVKNGNQKEFEYKGVHYSVIEYAPHKMKLSGKYESILEVTDTSLELNLNQLLSWINEQSKDKMYKTLDDIQIGDQIEINGVSYEVVDKLFEKDTNEDGFEIVNVYQINLLKSITDEIVINVPNVIEHEDIPQVVDENRSFTVDSIVNPEYTIIDDQEPGNRYIVTDKFIKKLNDDGTEELINDGSVIGYMQLIGSDTTNNGGACEDPYDNEGCPVGTTRDFIRKTRTEYDYDGIQYDDINDILGQNAPEDPKTVDQLVEGDQIVGNDGTVYTVVVPVNMEDDPTSLTVEFIDHDSDKVKVTLVEGVKIDKYSKIIETVINYTIESVKPKEYNVTWNNASMNGNIKYPEKSYHLIKDADVTYVNDITWEKIPNKEKLKVDDEFDLNGHTFTVSSINLDLDNIVLKDEQGQMYFFTPDQVTNITPIDYQDIIAYEDNNSGIALKQNDEFNVVKQRRIEKGDDFTIDGKKYTLLTVRDATDIIVGFAIEDDAPLSYAEMEEAFKDTVEKEINGIKYTIKLESVNDEDVTIMQDEIGNEYHYWRYHLHNDDIVSDDIVDEGFVIDYNIDIMIPNDITYVMLMEIFGNNDPSEGDVFRFNDVTYTVKSIDDEKIKIVDTNNKEKVIDRYYDPSDTYTTFNKYFINEDTVYDLDDIFKPNELVSYICDNSNVLIDGNLMLIKGINNFDVTMSAVDNNSPIRYNDMIDALGQIAPEKSQPSIGDKLNINGLEYTVEDVLLKYDVPIGYVVSRNNIVDPSVKNEYTVMVEAPITIKDVTWLFNNGVGDSFKVDGIKYTIEEKYDTEKGKEYVVSTIDANDNVIKYVLSEELIKEDDGEKVIIQVLDFTTTQEVLNGKVKIIETLPIFRGKTGNNYLRVVDRANHNAPVAGYETIISTDVDGFDIVKTAISDKYGIVDVNDLPAGTYYYNAPGQIFRSEFTVYAADQIEGELKVSSLKWGREYMACEVGLPKGYDYADATSDSAKYINDGEVCFTFKMDVEEGKTFQYANPVNQIRKLDLEVYKVDQDDKSMLLNGAYFTVEDITNEGVDTSHHDDGTFINKVSFEDVPSDAAVGTKFNVMTDEEHSKNYKVTKIEGTTITVECIDDGMSYTLTKDLVDINKPLIYKDVIDAAKGFVNVYEGFEFSAHTKVSGSLKTYQVVEVVLAEGGDIWQPSEDNDYVDDNNILGYYLIDINDDNKQKIWVENDYYNMPTIGSAVDLGTYVSGSIYKKVSMEVQNEAIIFDEVMAKVNNAPNVGDIIEHTVIEYIETPKYEDVPTNLNVGESFIFNDVSFTLISKDEGILKLQYDGADEKNQIEIYKESVAANLISIERSETFEIVDIVLGIDDEVLTMTLTDSKGNDHLVWLGQYKTYKTVGKPNVKYEIYDDVSLSKESLIYSGLSDKNGEIVYAPENNGTYFLKIDGEVEKWDIEKGKFTLPDLKYGTKVRICETKSPLGYITGEACEVIVIDNDNDTVVKNYKTNKKIVEEEEGGKKIKKRRVRIRKMGSDADDRNLDPFNQ